jgi:DNA-directed RNA polymerase subunit RPC12/RpoP
MYEDAYPWPIKCDVCLNEFTKEVGGMKAGEEVRCPECGLRIVYTVESGAAMTDRVDLQFAPSGRVF